jgi:DNA-binding transcriptional ArsR family regulator
MTTSRDARAGLVFSALADATRRQLVRQLAADGPATISGLAAELPISRQATAKHLGILAEAGLVEVEAAGRERRCSFAGDPLTDAVGWLLATGDGWDRRLDRLQRAAREDAAHAER